MCPQASTDWSSIAGKFLPAYLTGTADKFNFTAANITAYGNIGNMSEVQPQPIGVTEDCLFLDVMAPQKIFDNKGGAGAPVMVWIYGGGFVGGSKTSSGNPAGLIAASQASGSDGFVYVALNYRLGALGWMSGDAAKADGIQQPGLYDQRLALKWVQDNIHLFGGDPNQVTVMGESAGSSSIMHQITAFGGSNGSAPFSKAIMQSPAFQPYPDTGAQNQAAQAFLDILGVKTLAEARKLSSDQIIQANSYQVSISPYGSFSYGPVVDGVFAPALPGQLLAEGRYDDKVHVMVGHNQNEGLLFSNPSVNSTAQMTMAFQAVYQNISKSVLGYIEDVLYPANFTGGFGYTDMFTRYVQAISEYAVTCNTVFLDAAFSNQTYAYQFDVAPALHGFDVAYTFWNGKTSDSFGLPLNTTIAKAFQEYLTSFAVSGDPAAAGFPKFSMYGANSSIIDVQGSAIQVMIDDVTKSRCAFWQQGLFSGQEVDVNGNGIAANGAEVISSRGSPAPTSTAAIFSGTVDGYTPKATGSAAGGSGSGSATATGTGATASPTGAASSAKAMTMTSMAGLVAIFTFAILA
jgi:carboxylesterase type B